MHRVSLLYCLAPYLAFSIAEDSPGRLNITKVTNETFDVLGITKSIFSLHDALFPDFHPSTLYAESAYEYGTTYLFADACQQGDTTLNCTASCNDTSLMFANLETLHNCMVFPKVATHRFEHNITQNASDLADQLRIEASQNNSNLYRDVTGLIQTCLTDYCTSIHGCPEYYGYMLSDTDYGYTTAYKNASNWNFVEEGSYLVESICETLKIQFRVNSDIGGIGVYVSYWIQTGIALLGFAATLLWNSWIYYIYHGILTLRHGFKKAHEKARWIRNGNRKHLSRLAMALTDFQKAQCFFMVTINIAAQVVIWEGGLQPNSLQQIYNTYVFIKVLAINGYLPITFTLFTLHMIGMVSWYLLVLSVSSVALSVATLVTIGDFKPSTADLNDLASAFAAGGPDSCGKFQLSAFCYVPIEYDYNVEDSTFTTTSIGDAAFKMLAFCLVALLLLVFEKAKIAEWPTTQRLMRWLFKKLAPCLKILASFVGCIRRAFEHPVTRRVSHWILDMWSICLHALVRAITWIQLKFSTQPVLHRCSKPLARKVASWRGSDRYIMAKNTSRRFSQQSWTNAKRLHHTADYTQVCRQLFVASLYIVFSCLYIYWFSIFSQLLGWFATNEYYNTTWNFGQIVAITVWAPPLCEYIHLELRGMRRGFDHKLLPPYRITKEKDPSTDIEPRLEDNVPIVSYGEDPDKGDYSSLESPESPESVRRYSVDDLKWQLPTTVLPKGDLSPFSSP